MFKKPSYNICSFQTKLKIGRPGDQYEQQADRVADAVMQMPDPAVRPQPADEEEETLQMQPLQEEEEMLQMQAVDAEEEEELRMQPLEEEEEQLQTNQQGGGGLCPGCRERLIQGRYLDCPDCEKKLSRKQEESNAEGVSRSGAFLDQHVAKKAGKARSSSSIFSRESSNFFFSSSSERSEPFFMSNTVQPKLQIGAPNDKYEQEVDSIVETLVPYPQIQRQQSDYIRTGEQSENYEIDYDKAKELNETYQSIFWGKLLGKVKHGLFLEWEEIWKRGDWNEFANRVASYQWLRGLKVDGALGPETWKRISDLPFVYKWQTFTAKGTQTQADNNCGVCPQDLGVDTGFYDKGGYGPAYRGNRTNGIELRAFIANHDAGYTYDVKRTIERSSWERTGAGAWNLMSSKPAGTNDDPNNLDEYPIPGNPPLPTPAAISPSSDLHHVYSTDQPGLKPVRGKTVTKTSTEAVKKATFTEYLEITHPRGGKREDDHKWDWHSTTWLVKRGSNWVVDAGQSEIGDGSQTVGTTAP